MTLSKIQKVQLKAAAHHLKPLANIGRGGLSETFLQSLDQTLTARELIKIKLLNGGDLNKQEEAANLAKELKAEIVGIVGFIIILYRYSNTAKTHIL